MSNPSPYAAWKRAKVQASTGIVFLRLEDETYITFDEDAETTSRECLGADYVPQVLDQPLAGGVHEFRFRAVHASNVTRTLMRKLHNVFFYDLLPEEQLKEKV